MVKATRYGHLEMVLVGAAMCSAHTLLRFKMPFFYKLVEVKCTLGS